MQRVIVQADRASRMNADDILNYNVKNSRGQLVPFSAFASGGRVGVGLHPDCGLQLLSRRAHLRRSQARLHLSATPSPRWSGLPTKLPRGFGYEWTGQSLQEKLSGSQAPFLLGLSVLVVFLPARGAL